MMLQPATRSNRQICDGLRFLVVNRPPTANIEKPLPADALFAHIPVQFIASVGDQDEEIPEGSVTWTSNKDGGLGAGRGRRPTLAIGFRS